MVNHGIVGIVEDDEDIREALKMLFEMEGYHTVTASNGMEALKILERLEPLPAVLVVDLMMPVMDGWELIKVTRKKYSSAELPIIVMSAIADRFDGNSSGVCAVLKKPVNIEKILTLVAKQCSRVPKAAA
jgi:DNA-binding response OmpR family regulator